VASHSLPIRESPQHGLFNPATLFSDRASGMKAASAGGIDRRGHIASQNDSFLSNRWIRNRDGADQSLRIGMFRAPADLFRGADFHKLSEVHYADSPRELLDHGDGMAYEKIGESKLPLKFQQQVRDLCLDGNIQRRHGFVGNNELWIQSQRASDPDALPLAATEFVGIAPHGSGIESHNLQEFDDAIFSFGSLKSFVNREGLSNYRSNPHARIKGRVRILEDDLHIASTTTEIFSAEFQQVDAVKSDFSRVGLDQAQDRTAGRRFATSRFTDEAEGFAAEDGKADVVHGFHMSRYAGENALLQREILL